MSSFQDLARHFGALEPGTVASLVVIAEARGREDLSRQQSPAGLETLRQVALIQSTESSNAIENIRAPRARIEALVAERTTPRNRPEQEIAGYRDVLGLIHANRADIPFEPRYVEQLHGDLYRYTGDTTAGHWKRLDNKVQEERPDATWVDRFTPVAAADTPAAMRDLHERFQRALADNTYPPLLLCAAYIFDFTVIHPFRDGNGRMSRLITLWLLYIIGHDVGRFVSIEKLIEGSKDSYYETLSLSTMGWHDGEHDLTRWIDYFLGILIAAYSEFERRAITVLGRGSKKALITTFIDSLLVDEFAVAEVRRAAPGVSDTYISKILGELKKAGTLEPIGTGRGARWRRLRP
ncbi:MAG TPA: Fic family protein [Solirubrobacteraceae bacterium]|nr:Fic family protein [Solirubrobacteraceae bacterium]